MPNGDKAIKLYHSDKRWDARIDLMNFCKKTIISKNIYNAPAPVAKMW